MTDPQRSPHPPAQPEDEPIVLDPTDPAFALDPKADDAALIDRVLRYYSRSLSRSESALAFLRENAISPALIDRFGLGFGDRSLGLLIPRGETKAGRAMRGRLTTLGIYRSSGHEHFRGSLTVPVRDHGGTLLQVYGHKILEGELRDGTAIDTWLAGRAIPPLWNAQAVTDENQAIVTGDILDALALISAGLDHSLAVVTSDSAAAIAALVEREAEYLWLAHPRTEAGDAAAMTLANLAAQHDLISYRVRWPFGMTARSYAQKFPTADALPATVRIAEEIRGEDDDEADGDAEEGPPGPRDPEKRAKPSSRAGFTPTVTAPTPTTICQPAAEPAPAPSLPVPTTDSRPVSTAPSSPPPAVSDIAVRVDGDDLHAVIGDRHYRLRGFGKNTDGGALRVTLRASSEAGAHVDALDLYHARGRVGFQNAAAEELGVKPEVVKRDLGRLILAAEQALEERARTTEKPADTKPVMTPEEEAEALALLRDPKLTERIIADFDRCGIVGEEMNKLIGYLAAISRKLDDPLAIVIQSSSAAGKTSLMDAVLAFVPPEDLVQFSSMTSQSLFYMAENGLSHRVLAIAEEAGSERVTYSLKLLQSEGELRIASTGKDAQTGKLTTTTYSVAGPVALFLTTTSIDLDEELANRCLILAVDEGRAQTRAVHAAQRARQTLAGKFARSSFNKLLNVHRNAQRLLKPVLVVNPHAERLSFPDERTRCRRDHAKYLALIEAVAFLHQYQRERKTIEHEGKPVEYIEATIEDVAFATRLAHHALGRSLDELPPQTRRLLNLIAEMVDESCRAKAIDRADFRFTRRDVRGFTRWGHSQLAIHLGRLEDLEYVIAHAGENGRSYVYELADAGSAQGGTTLPGLIDVARLYDPASGAVPPASGGLPGEGRKLESIGNLRPSVAIQGQLPGLPPKQGEGLSTPVHRTRLRRRRQGAAGQTAGA